MIRRSQSQTGGDNSVNIQGRDIAVGLTYSDARQVAMDVFESNFHRLSAAAGEMARSRAEHLVDEYLSAMADSGIETIPEAENPDFQYALFTAQKEYARAGDKDLGELLVQLLVDRTKAPTRDLIQIVLNESLSVAPKLTPDQLNVLTTIFILRYTRQTAIASFEDFIKYLRRYVLPFSDDLPRKTSAYQHLEFASCGTISIGETAIPTFFSHSYTALFAQGFSEDRIRAAGLDLSTIAPLLMPALRNPALLQVNCMNEEVLLRHCKLLGLADEACSTLKALQASDQLSAAAIKGLILQAVPDLRKLFDTWEDSPMKNMSLTSVGIAIGHANLRRRTGESFDLSIWL